MSIPAKDRLHGADAERVREEAEVDSGRKPGQTTEVAAKLETMARENWQLRQANEILCKESAYFAQVELDRPFKR